MNNSKVFPSILARVIFVLLLPTMLVSAPYQYSIELSNMHLERDSYGLHGLTPSVHVDIISKSATVISDLKLEFFVDEQRVYELPFLIPPISPGEIMPIHIPWAAKLGKCDHHISVQVFQADRDTPGSSRIETQIQTEIRYDQNYVHPWLTRRACDFLQSKFPDGEYAELAEWSDRMAEGATHEDELDADDDGDDATQRYYRHFFRPTDHMGLLETSGFPPHLFECIEESENSLIWASGTVDCNAFDWQDAIAAYDAGDLSAAYYALGHVAHLLEDVSVPAHTHLDIHAVSITDDYGDDYEDYCQSVIEGGGSLPLPEPSDPIISFDNLEDFWVNPGAAFPYSGMARLAYYRNRYQCDLSNHDNPNGWLKNMYPNLEWGWDWGAFEDQWDVDSPDMGNWDESFGDACPSWFAGSVGDDEFWATNIPNNNPDSPYHFYVENTEEVPLYEKASWDPNNSDNDVYVANSGGLTQMEAFARDLVPLCVQYIAGLMKFYYDTVNPPSLDVPTNVSITVLLDHVLIAWDPVVGAALYRVYSSNSPYDSYDEDLTGIFDGTSWTAPYSGGGSFYKVVAIGVR